MATAEFSIEAETPEYVFITDTGHAHTRTVTNDAEAVIETLAKDHALGDRRVFYRDSSGEIDELTHNGARFLDFAPSHAGVSLPGVI